MNNDTFFDSFRSTPPSMPVLLGVKYRECNGKRYLVPVTLIDRFDELSKAIDEYDSNTADFFAVCDVMRNDFKKYIMEGDIFDVCLFVYSKTFD